MAVEDGDKYPSPPSSPHFIIKYSYLSKYLPDELIYSHYLLDLFPDN